MKPLQKPEIKRADKTLQEIVANYEDLYENAPDMFASVDAKTTKIRHCNQTLAAALDYFKEEIIGRPVFDLYHPDCMEEVKKAFQMFQETGKVHNAELILKRKDGTKIDVILNVSSVLDEKGNILYSRSSWRDITELKQAEDVLRLREEELRAIIESTTDGILVTDNHGKIIHINNAMAKMWHIPEELIKTKADAKLLEYVIEQLVDPQAFLSKVQALYKSSAIDKDKINFKDGKVFDRLSSPLIFDNRMAGRVWVFRDITERKKAKSALWESEERFRMIMEQSPVSIQVMNPDGRAIKVNRAWEKLWGITMDDLRDYSILKDKQLETLGVMPYLKKGFSGEAVYIPAKKYDVTKTFGKGTVRWVQAHIYPVKDEKGDIRIVVLMHEDITDQKNVEIDLNKAFQEINRLKEQLEAENVYLREEVKLQHEHGEILGQSDAIKGVLKLVEQVAGTDSTVLILGETGTGKELLAQSIHNLSKRKDRPMVKVNCAAIPSNLIESELFGREKGAYTGALTTQVGRFEVADGSTLFLDEIGELSSELQAKLLRVLQDGSLERLGSTRTIKVDVRVIAATNRDIEQAVEDGTFRTDLYYRLNVFPIYVPPLRERHEDVLLLLWAFVREFEMGMGKQIENIPRSDIQALQSYSWPGNVREMKNLIERSMILTEDSTLRIEMPHISASGKSLSRTLDEIQKDHIISVLERTGWRVRGENGAAKILGLKPTTLDAKMKKLGIKR